MKKVNIGLKDEIHAQAKIISILKNMSFGSYLEKCVESAVEQDRKILGKFNSVKESEKNGR